MEELIRQAFLHVEGLGPHVAEGHYDLIGPTGAVVLPRVWEDMIQPDWAISMHMWPMPEPPRPMPEPPRPMPEPPRPHRHRSNPVSDPMGGPSQNGWLSGAPSIRPIGHPFLPPAPHTSTKSDLASPLTNFEHSSHFTGGPSKQNLGPAPPYVDSKPPFESGTSHTNLPQSASAISNTPPSSIQPRKPNKPSKGEQLQDMELPELEKKECDVSSDWELTATTLSRRALRKEKKQERKARSAANRQ